MSWIKKVYQIIITSPAFMAMAALIVALLSKSEIYGVTIYHEIAAIILVSVLSTIFLKDRFNRNFCIKFIIYFTVVFLIRDFFILMLTSTTPLGRFEIFVNLPRIAFCIIGKTILRILYSFIGLYLCNYITLKLLNFEPVKNIFNKIKNIILKPASIVLILICISLPLLFHQINSVKGKFTTLGQYSGGGFGSSAVLMNNNNLFTATINKKDNLIEYYIYNPFKNEKEMTGIIDNQEYSDFQIVALSNGNIFILGANYKLKNNPVRAIIFNPINGNAKYTPATSRLDADSSILELPGDKLLITGGIEYKIGPSKSAQIYDIKNNTFKKLPDMNEPRYKHASVLMKNNKVLLIGGYSKCAEIYDMKENKFTAVDIGFMTDVNNDTAKAFLLNDGKVFVYCVRKYLNDDGYDIQISDFMNNMTAMQNNTPAKMDYTVYYPFSYIGIFDPETNKMKDLLYGSKKHKISKYDVTQLKDGRILITGGRIGRGKGQGYHILNDAKIYDSNRHKFYNVSRKLRTERYAHECITLNDGRVLIWTGTNNTSLFINDIELFTLEN